MHGVYRMNEGELRMMLVQAQRRGCHGTARALERQIARRFAKLEVMA